MTDPRKQQLENIRANYQHGLHGEWQHEEESKAWAGYEKVVPPTQAQINYAMALLQELDTKYGLNSEINLERVRRDILAMRDIGKMAKTIDTMKELLKLDEDASS